MRSDRADGVVVRRPWTTTERVPVTVWLTEDGSTGMTIAGVELRAGDVVVVPMDVTAEHATVVRRGSLVRLWRRARGRRVGPRVVVFHDDSGPVTIEQDAERS